MSFSGSQRLVYKAFTYALGTGEIKNTTYKNNLKAYLTDCNFWSVNSANNNVTTRLDTLNCVKGLKGIKGNTSKITPTNLNLENINLYSFNTDTGLQAEVSYESLKNLPASGKIFSIENDGSWVTNDLDWSITALSDKNTENYFKTEYAFKDQYDKNEYRAYNLNENVLEENNIALTATDFLMTDKIGNPSAMDYGAGGLLLTYTDKNHINEKEIPVAFIQFAKHFNSNNNRLEIAWHQDGVIKIE